MNIYHSQFYETLYFLEKKQHPIIIPIEKLISSDQHKYKSLVVFYFNKETNESIKEFTGYSLLS